MKDLRVYNIIKSGSDGNAVLYFNNQLLVDVGVGYKMIKEYINDIKYIFITHIHSDHFNKITIKRIAKEKPLIKFIVGEYLYDNLLELGLNKHQITVVNPYTKYRLFKELLIEPIPLYHNVDNMGLKMYYKQIKGIHATDTYTLEHIEALNYNYYFIEENYCKIKVLEIQEYKRERGLFDHTVNSTENHLSKQDLDEWLGLNNKNGKGILVRLHQSKEAL